MSDQAEKLRTLCTDLAVSLNSPPDMDGATLLRALAWVESAFGTNTAPRFERAYGPSGPYYRRHVVTEYAVHGALVCCSWGPWQLMGVAAWELGFRAHARFGYTALDDPLVSGPFVASYLNRRVFARGAVTVAEVGDAYNSGTHRDAFVPAAYVEKLQAAYARELSNP